MSDDQFIILDLDGTLIPYDFELGFRRLATLCCSSVIFKIVVMLSLILHPLLYRFFVLLLKTLVKVTKVKTKGKYFSLSMRRSYFVSLLSFLHKLNPLDVDRCVSTAILDGLRKRRIVWNKIVLYCLKNKNKNKYLLVTGSSVLPLIEKVRCFLMIDHIFRSYTIAFGTFTLKYEINKASIIANTRKKIDVVITDSMEDLKVFNCARHKMLVRNDGYLLEVPL
ncbi:MAG: hypothetical protein QXM43_01090 [Desulfurococcaceae archaeon]